MSGSAAAASSAISRGSTGASSSASRGVGVSASRFAPAARGFENPRARSARSRTRGEAVSRSDAAVAELLNRGLALLTRADADRLVDRQHEDLPIADRAGLGRADDDRDHLVDHAVADHHLDLHLGQEVHGVLRAAVELGVAFLAAEAAHLGHRHADDADLGERLLDVVELERLDDGFDLLHGLTPRRGWGTSAPIRES